MIINHNREPLFLLVGDIVFFYISLFVTLNLRYGSNLTSEILVQHIAPFSILFVSWVVVFFIAGLYERYNSMMRRVLPATLLQSQIVNVTIGVLFFYLIPFFGIAPKTNLFIYLIVSLLLLVIWRLGIAQFFAPKSKYNALLIARGEEMKELREEINTGRYGYTITHSINLDCTETIDVQEDIVNPVYENNIQTVIIDTRDDSVIPLLSHFYNLMFSNITFIDMHDVYEHIFGRVPLSLVKHGWFLENVRSKPHVMYDTTKRLMDTVLSAILFVPSLIFYPIVFIGTKISDGGDLFYRDIRIGKNNQLIKLIKFRTLTEKDGGEKSVTKFGNILRRTRIDELPQLWNVLRGDMSLIGPRPERPDLVNVYKEQVPYYNVRHLIKPGLSGWAQMYQENHPHHGADVIATKEKLSYDLYYIKNRSFLLDIKISLQTIKTIASQKGK